MNLQNDGTQLVNLLNQYSELFPQSGIFPRWVAIVIVVVLLIAAGICWLFSDRNSVGRMFLKTKVKIVVFLVAAVAFGSTVTVLWMQENGRKAEFAQQVQTASDEFFAQYQGIRIQPVNRSPFEPTGYYPVEDSEQLVEWYLLLVRDPFGKGDSLTVQTLDENGQRGKATLSLTAGNGLVLRDGGEVLSPIPEGEGQ